MTEQDMPEVAVAAEPTPTDPEASATAETTPAAAAQTSESAQERPTPTEQVPTPSTRRRRRPTKAKGNYPPVQVIPPKKIVKVLAVGMELEGRVKRLADFGAFIDIGVGRDGLVHISEVSPKRVSKISDVLKEGDTVKVWIKALDRAQNRISLTMIPPGTRTLRDLNEGEVLTGKVTRLAPYGAFVDIGVERDGMLHVKEMSNGYVAKPEDVVQVGDTVQVRIIRLDKRRGRIDLSMKGLRPEMEPQQTDPEPAAPDQDLEDDEDVSIIELAFQKAQYDKRRERRERYKQREREEDERQAELDEIISRTLRQHRGSD